MKKLLFIFILSSLFFSCAKKETAPAEFKVQIAGLSAGISQLNANGEGGLALWGRNKTTGTKFGHVFQAPYPSDIGFDLDLGDWEFYGILWAGDDDGILEASDKLTGATRCAFIGNYNVQTASRVNLNFNANNCANGMFSPAAYMSANTFMNTKIVGCDHLMNVNSASYLCSSEKSLPFTYKVRIHDYETTIGDQPMVLESECQTYSAPDNLVQIASRLPYGINNNSPFKISFHAYQSNDCTVPTNVADGPAEFSITYVNGIGQKPHFFDRAENGANLYINGSNPIQFLALNELGAGWSPLHTERPFLTCLDNSGNPVDCVGRFNTSPFHFSTNYNGGSGTDQYISQLKIKLSDVLRYSIDESNVNYCKFSSPNNISFKTWNGGSWSTATSPFYVQKDANGYCIINLYNNIGPSDTHQGAGTAYTFNMQLCSDNSCSTAYDQKNGWDSIETMYQIFYFSGQLKNILTIKELVAGVTGYRDGQRWSEHCIGMNCQTQSNGGEHFGVLSNVRELLGIKGYLAPMGKLGYKTCSSINNQLSNVGSTTLNYQINDFETNVPIYLQYKILPATKARLITAPASMDGAAGNFSFRLEVWMGDTTSNLNRVAVIETDCLDNTTFFQPQMYIEINDSHTGVNENETKKFKGYIKAQKYGATNSVTLPDQSTMDVEDGVSGQDVYLEIASTSNEYMNTSEQRNSRRNFLSKFSYDTGSREFTFAIMTANKESSQDDLNVGQYRHSWRLYRVFGMGSSVSHHIRSSFSVLEDEANNNSFSTFAAAYPVDNICSYQKLTTSLSANSTYNFMSFDSTEPSTNGSPINATAVTQDTLSGVYTASSGWFSDYFQEFGYDRGEQFSLANSSQVNSCNGFSNNWQCVGTLNSIIHLPGGNTESMTSADQFNMGIFSAQSCKNYAEKKYGSYDRNRSSFNFTSQRSPYLNTTSTSQSSQISDYCIKVTNNSAFKDFASTTSTDCNFDTNNNGVLNLDQSNYLQNISSFDYGPDLQGLSIVTHNDWYLNYIGSNTCGGKTQMECDMGF